jgi:hypothetical protein
VADQALRYEFRPLEWEGPLTHGMRKTATFRATYPATLELLFREARNLGAKHLILQVDIRERDIRTDGLPRANARHGENPGVIVSFESRFGPLRYATDVYCDWRDNLRAIALSLEALRAVDRYGVSKRGEQYTGWKALPAGPGPTFGTADAALAWMRETSRHSLGHPGGSPRDMYRQLAKAMHPDKGGDPADWDKLDQARNLLVTAGLL